LTKGIREENQAGLKSLWRINHGFLKVLMHGVRHVAASSLIEANMKERDNAID
jgi:hypothetical protein